MNRSEYIRVFEILSKHQTYMAECVKITRGDGTIFRFTSHDHPLTIREPDGRYQRYERANSFVMTTIETSYGLAVSNMDIDGIIDDDAITEEDLRLGKFNHARVDLYLAYWRDKTVKVLPLRASWIGEIQTENEKFKVDLRGIANKLAQTFIQATSLECRFQFTDAATCGLTSEDFEVEYSVNSVEAADTFTVPIAAPLHDNKYQWGLAQWQTGDNAGSSMEIMRQYEDRVQLFLPMPFDISNGDTVILRQGCNKTYPTCCNRFANGRRFGAEPFLAGGDMLTRYPVRETQEPNADFLGLIAQ